MSKRMWLHPVRRYACKPDDCINCALVETNRPWDHEGRRSGVGDKGVMERMELGILRLGRGWQYIMKRYLLMIMEKGKRGRRMLG